MAAPHRGPSPGAWLPRLWVVALSVLILGPALKPGFVLSYDMVWVPDLAVRRDLFGLSTALPRAVPSDAVIAVLDEIVPGEILQKVVLLGALVTAGLGAQRLVGGSALPRIVAGTCYLWNPFVAERLWIGHWPLLVGYAVLPWLLLAAVEVRDSRSGWARLAWLVPLGSLSASTGLATALAVALVAGRWRTGTGRARHRLALAGILAAGNAPWVVAGLLHARTATGVSGSAFAVTSEGRLPTPLTAVGLGGIWNSEVVPASREGVLAWIGLAGLTALAAVGARRWWQRTDLRAALVGCWATGFTLALIPAAWPGVVDWLGSTVPGGGLVRDSGRFLALCAPLVAVAAAAGAETILSALPDLPSRVSIGIALVMFPMMTLPDLAWGVGGALQPTAYPASYAAAREVLRAADAERPGDVVVLPFTSYREPWWNHRAKVYAPLGRYLTPNDVTSDELSVSGRVLSGEDPRGAEVRAALALPTPEARTAGLTALGIRYAALEPGGPGLAGEVRYTAPDILILELAGSTTPRTAPTSWRWALGAAWIGWLTLLVGGSLVGVGRQVLRPFVRNHGQR